MYGSTKQPQFFIAGLTPRQQQVYSTLGTEGRMKLKGLLQAGVAFDRALASMHGINTRSRGSARSSVEQKALEKVRTAALAFPGSSLLTTQDQARKLSALAAAQSAMGSTLVQTALKKSGNHFNHNIPLSAKQIQTLEDLKKKSARNTLMSTPAQRALQQLQKRKDALKRVRQYITTKKQRPLTSTEKFRLKTDTEALASLPIAPSEIIHKGKTVLAPKKKSVWLHKQEHIRKKFPKGQRPRKTRQVVGVLATNGILNVPPEQAHAVLSVAFPKMRSRKADAMSVALVLRSPLAARYTAEKKKMWKDWRKLSQAQRLRLKRLEKLLAQLKLRQKRFRTLQRQQDQYAKIQDNKNAARAREMVNALRVGIAQQEAELLTEIAVEGPLVQDAVESQITVALSEADIEDIMEEMAPLDEATLVAQGADIALVADAQVAAILAESAPTVDDAIPQVRAEADTPAIDADLVDRIEDQKGVDLTPDELLDLADATSFDLADQMITQDANQSSLGADKDKLLEELKKNLPLLLVGGAAIYYVFFRK